VSQEREAWVQQFYSLNAVAPPGHTVQGVVPQKASGGLALQSYSLNAVANPGHTVQGVVASKREAWVRQPYSLNAVARPGHTAVLQPERCS
jgi:hypothetical protein